MSTYFASAERADEKQVAREIEIVNNSPVVSGLLQFISGMLVVLDEHRQVIAVNDSFLKELNINDPAEALGLRPGTIVKCIYADDGPNGCGTSKFCSSCGVAVAIVSSLSLGKYSETNCALTVKRESHIVDIALQVRSHPIKIEDSTFLLLFLQDISIQKQRAALEKTFFHDINNMLVALLGTSELLSFENSQSDLVKIIHSSSLRLKKEFEIQRSLSQSEFSTYHPIRENITTEQIQDELKSFFTNHPSALGKKIIVSQPDSTLSLYTDFSLLTRVLCNMITNAFEATEENGTVKVWFDQNDNQLSFYIWNNKSIPENISLRIFQRNFSTKSGDGRGLGTYSMKLFGEKILGGEVTFTTSDKEGTVFKISLPVSLL